MDFIEKEVASSPDLADKYGKLGELYSRKLWHQLTEKLLEMILEDGTIQGDKLVPLYEEFITKFEAKLNQLQFARIIVGITRKISDPDTRISLMEKILEKRARLGADAALLLEMETTLLRIQKGEVAEVRDTLEQGKETLDGLLAAETIVHASVYRAASEYHKAAGPPEEYYKNALMQLAYTPVDSKDMSSEEKAALAVNITLAALTGDGVYNFGEVLATPILSALEGTPESWLGDLLKAFHEGNVDAFAMCVGANQASFDAQPALASRKDFVRQKMSLLSLMNMVFERPSHDRNIRFQEIADRTKIPFDQVELLVMRAMSLGLIRGIMDGVEQVLSVSWVQPRVLDKPQLKHLCDRLGEWKENVHSTLTFVEDQTPELFN
mmetsp:Transcript_15466/g.19791  ORF Transcript_15466/g.19791 Transcript_15466/m.19791 type:complete len:381 (-) Transcript_15466:184-1326(-)|eukprot:CAMPEP_0117756374 /NCGR_PEP_ID=MMETSP0947-20121206/14039_1 /TAXON_ID=44440 /ORGANISM="Chattonella subsalsa, Strain CCMP2191" /LENGTH=380 /DNA_ID=CAMNT_0005575947 /DNA_START=143 /DNA_END=1285 /DNA_ORIENTATION=+